MSQNAAAPRARVAPAPVPLRELLPWAVFAGVVLLALLYLVGLDHDGRHLLAFPCH